MKNIKNSKSTFTKSSTVTAIRASFLLGLAGLTSSAFPDEIQKRSPNIIYILTDDQGWSQINTRMHPDIPESMSPYLETPAMKRLAREGMVFSSGYSPAPICTPTRRSVLTGATTARCGTEFDSSLRPGGEFIPHNHLTIPKALKQADPSYMAAHFGKWGEQMISAACWTTIRLHCKEY